MGDTTATENLQDIICRVMAWREHAERIGGIAAESTPAAVRALLAGDWLERALGEHTDFTYVHHDAFDAHFVCDCGHEFGFQDGAHAEWVTHLAAAIRAAASTPGAQAAAWAARCEALDAASATERLAALHRVMDATVDDLERAGLVPDDYEYTPNLSIGEFRILTGNLQFRAGMTGSLDSPAAHFIVTTSDDDDPGIAMKRTTTDLGQVRAWLMSWTVGAR